MARKTISECSMFPWTKIPELDGLNGSCFLGSAQILQCHKLAEILICADFMCPWPCPRSQRN